MEKQRKRKLIYSTECYKTYLEGNVDGDIITIYDLVKIRQIGQSEIFASRVFFLWKYQHLFSVVNLSFDHKIPKIESRILGNP